MCAQLQSVHSTLVPELFQNGSVFRDGTEAAEVLGTALPFSGDQDGG
jgi:hypothetical protein